MKYKITEKISVRDDVDHYSREEVILGDLTEKQYKALQEVARLSPPEYCFEVIRYGGGPSSTATHVAVLKEFDPEKDPRSVGLVGKDCAEYYDRALETENVVRRILRLVYRKTVSHCLSLGGGR